MKRRRFLSHSGAAVIAALGAPGRLRAAPDWPVKPIKVIVGYPPGGSADLVARDLFPGVSKLLGQPMVVDYRPGAAGTLAADATAKTEADGYTLGLLDASPMTIGPHLRRVPFDPRTSFTPIASVSFGPMVLLAHPSLPVTDLDGLLALARSKPGKLSYASSGQGTAQHLCGELFKSMAGLFILHVPYRGTAPALNDVVAGQIELAIVTVGPALPFIRAGRVKALAVTTRRRSSVLPQVPTFDERGLRGFDIHNWVGLFGPAGLDRAIVSKMGAAVAGTVVTPEFVSRTAANSGEVGDGTAAQLRGWLESDFQRWGALIRDRKIIAE